MNKNYEFKSMIDLKLMGFWEESEKKLLPVRIELTTLALLAPRSNQLSYGSDEYSIV
jgi:hypothetical protein